LDTRALPAPEIVGEEDYRAPVSEHEKLVAGLFETLTGASRVGLDDSFFALGGHSLLAIKLISKLSEITGISLPIRTIFENQTVAALSEQLGLKRRQFEYQPLIALRVADVESPVIFCVHPAGGYATVYSELARQLPFECSVYGIQARGLGQGEESFESLEAMLNAYLSAIVKHQPHGPYHFIGYSSGGIIAYELALRLSARGEVIKFVALLDSILPSEKDAGVDSTGLAAILEVAKGFGWDQDEAGDMDQMYGFIYEKLLNANHADTGLGLEWTKRVVRELINSRRRLVDYKPTFSAFDLFFFVASSEAELPGLSQRRLDWKNYNKNNRYILLPTTHHNMLDLICSKKIASEIDDYLYDC
jgi:thioesterase domain-containing protein/acyl carrier protein